MAGVARAHHERLTRLEREHLRTSDERPFIGVLQVPRVRDLRRSRCPEMSTILFCPLGRL